MKNTLFLDQWSKLESSTAYYWQLLQSLPEEDLKYQPDPQRWSVLQVMEHLVGAEEAGLQYLIKKNYAPLTTRSLLPAFLRSFLLKWALRSPLRFKAPNVSALVPYNTTPPDVLLKKWQQDRTALLKFIEQAPARVRAEPLFRHPTAGPLTLAQMLLFMREHLDHHRRQLKLILDQKNKPA